MKALFAALVLAYAMSATAADDKTNAPYHSISGVAQMVWTDKRSDFDNDPWPFKFMSDDTLVSEIPDNKNTGNKILTKYLFVDGKLAGAMLLYEGEPTDHSWKTVEKQLTDVYGADSDSAWTDSEKSAFGIPSNTDATYRRNPVVLVVHAHISIKGVAFQTVSVVYAARFKGFVDVLHEG